MFTDFEGNLVMTRAISKIGPVKSYKTSKPGTKEEDKVFYQFSVYLIGGQSTFSERKETFVESDIQRTNLIEACK